MTQNEFTLLNTIRKCGLLSHRKIKDITGLSTGYISQTLNAFAKEGLTDECGITDKGREALLPYKVNNAVIMAAGMGTHFVPITLEKPKGLLVVKNEVLIERQIGQLQEAGIKEIVIILGYKKEAFFYLERKFDGLKIIINPEYNTKNNTHTLYLAGKYIHNSYICSSDDYFEENPFDEYVYQSYYSGVHVDSKANEWYMVPDSKGNISKIKKSGTDGYIMLGHAYWNNDFSTAMLKILDEDHDVGNYDQAIWEQILVDNIKKLPPIAIKEYPAGVIFEFDSLEDLRKFDTNYVDHTHTKIMRNIASVLGCGESDILNFKAIKEGLTNTSFVFEVSGKKYVYRHPGDGTEAIISRLHEKKALELAKSISVDPTFICMDHEQGWKISSFVEGVRTPDYDNFEDSKRVLYVLRSLHDKNLNVDWSFFPWEEACKIEVILRSDKGGIADSHFEKLKENVEKCYKRCNGDGIKMRFCHCDTYAPNWMLTEKETILIDWEYAGNADPGCDVGSYIMDAMWDIDEAEKFIKEYCGKDMTGTQLFHYLAYTAIVSFYWYVWALYREACGAVMGESLYNWHVMAERYSAYLVDKYEL
ncbi:MAG: phosphotransferase [Lachnospiraceae bacterium]|nr:phosphotransferase [Candidatus Minthocola equi]